jgi:hypothetical protein
MFDRKSGEHINKTINKYVSLGYGTDGTGLGKYLEEKEGE